MKSRTVVRKSWIQLFMIFINLNSRIILSGTLEKFNLFIKQPNCIQQTKFPEFYLPIYSPLVCSISVISRFSTAIWQFYCINFSTSCTRSRPNSLPHLPDLAPNKSARFAYVHYSGPNACIQIRNLVLRCRRSRPLFDGNLSPNWESLRFLKLKFRFEIDCAPPFHRVAN